MTQFIQMLDLQMTLVLYLLVGAFSYKAGIITDNNRNAFMALLLNILLPVMVFNSFREVTLDLLKLSFSAAIAATIIYSLVTLASKILYRKFPEAQDRILQYATLVNNAGFAGLPMAQSVFGEAGAIIASVYLVPHRIFMWTVGVDMLTPKDSGATIKSTLTKLAKNPSIIAVVLGLIRGLLQLPLPDFVDRGFGSISGMVSPMAMIIIGSVIATVPLKGLFDKGLYYYSFIRLLLIPAIVMVVMTSLDLDPRLIGTVIILTSMPAGTTTPILASKFGLDVTFASKLVFVSIVLSIFTVPFLMSFL